MTPSVAAAAEFGDLAALTDDLAAEFTALADEIWLHAELGFCEVRSVAAQTRVLARHGFAIRRDIAGLATAFVAETGSAGPVIAFLGEYDALPGLSQEAGALHEAPVEVGASGHGCGHNLLGAGSMLAATALARHLERSGAPGRVRYYGCPAEDGGFAKGLMVAAGAFDDADVAIGWHPGTFNGVRARATQSVLNRVYRFRGTTAHAGMAPHLGRSALDALELMNIGANFMREHMAPGTSLQYAITDGGGVAPNVVPARAAAHYMIRAPRMAEARDLAGRIDDLARGAALMTGTTAAVEACGGASNVVPNLPLLHEMHACLAAFGPLHFDPDEMRHAAALVETLATVPQAAYAHADILPDAAHIPFHTGVRAFDGTLTLNPGSTDVGDVSWIVPTVECATATWAAGTPSHSWQAVAQGKSTSAQRAMIRAAKVMAATGARVACDPLLRAAARADLEARRGGEAYLSPFADSGTTELAVPARDATR